MADARAREPVPGEPLFLLKDALYQLTLPAAQQRRRLADMVVTDELALDLDAALTSLEDASHEAGIRLDTELAAALDSLMSIISGPPGDSLWHDESLDGDPRWEQARRVSIDLLGRIESQTQ